MNDTAAMGELLQPFHLIILFVIGLPLLVLDFLPTIIASVRRTKNFGWIFVFNFLLGWTIVGWIVALIWALRDEPKYVMTAPPPSGM